MTPSVTDCMEISSTHTHTHTESCAACLLGPCVYIFIGTWPKLCRCKRDRSRGFLYFLRKIRTYSPIESSSSLSFLAAHLLPQGLFSLDTQELGICIRARPSKWDEEWVYAKTLISGLLYYTNKHLCVQCIQQQWRRSPHLTLPGPIIINTSSRPGNVLNNIRIKICHLDEH